MQNFSLTTMRSQKSAALELEIVKEQASALGRAGRKLRLALEAYAAAEGRALSEREQHKLLSEIADAAYGLLLQREFIGFTVGNLEWLHRCYKIPERAIALIGALK